MEQRLHVMARAQDGVFSAGDAMALGITGNDLTALVRQGTAMRLRRSAYVLTDVWEAADIGRRYRLRVKAVLRTRPGTDRASHHSALSMFGLGIYGAPLTLVAVESAVAKPRVRPSLIVQPPTPADGYRFGNLRSVNPALACVQVAARYGFEAGVCAMDSALHHAKCSTAELHEALLHVPERQRRRARLAIDAAEPLTESVGESRTRIILRDAGLSFVPQFTVRDGDTHLGRVDFLVEECVVVEFDGQVKYAGAAGTRALMAEKERESRISRLGYEVERIIWSELDDPIGILRRITEAAHVGRARRQARLR